MENDDDARKSLIADKRRSHSDDTSTRTYYDLQQPSLTTVSYFREVIVIVVTTFSILCDIKIHRAYMMLGLIKRKFRHMTIPTFAFV